VLSCNMAVTVVFDFGSFLVFFQCLEALTPALTFVTFSFTDGRKQEEML